MKCQTVRALMLDTLDQEHTAEVEAHLKTCTECRRFAAQITRIDQRLHYHADHLNAPDDALTRLQAAIAAQPENEVIYLDPAPAHPMIETLKNVFTAGLLRRNPAVLRAFSGAMLIAMLVLFIAMVLNRPADPQPANEATDEATNVSEPTPEDTPTSLPASEGLGVLYPPARIAFVIDAPDPETGERGPNIEFCDDGFNELHVTSMAAINVMDKGYPGYEFELFEQYDAELQTYDGDAIIILQTRSCDADEESGFSVGFNFEGNQALATCMSSYSEITGLPHANIPRPYTEFNMLPNGDIPTILLELGSLSADRDLLDHQEVLVADALMAGLDCFSAALRWPDTSLADVRPPTPQPIPATGRITYSYTSGPEHGLYLYNTEEARAELVWSDLNWPSVQSDWTEDGTQIVWSGNRSVGSKHDLDLFTINSADYRVSNPVVEPLVTLPGDDIDPEWSPNGKRVVFASDAGDSGTDEPNFELYVLDVASGAVTRLTYDQAQDTQPTWSPDGLWIAYRWSTENQTDLMMMRADGSDGPYQLTFNPNMKEMMPDWSPNGSDILFAAGLGDRSGGIYTLSLSNPQITLELVTETYLEAAYPTWSPDGLKISFITLNSGSPILYVMNADGSNIEEIYATECCGNILSPDWIP